MSNATHRGRSLVDSGVVTVTMEARRFDEMREDIDHLTATLVETREALLQLRAATQPGGPLHGWLFDEARGYSGGWVRMPITKWRVWIDADGGPIVDIIDARTENEAADAWTVVHGRVSPTCVYVAPTDESGTVARGTAVRSVVGDPRRR